MSDLTGWLLEVYDDPGGGVVLWLLGDDGVRHRLHQDFPVTFYAAGPAAHLRQLWRYLQEGKVPVKLSRTERRDLFQPEPVTVLSIEVEHPADQPPLFQQLARLFPELTYYDADLPLALRFAALHGTFPLARCRMCADEEDYLRELSVLDSPWDLDPPLAPPLRVLGLEPDTDPFHAVPTSVLLTYGRSCYRLRLAPARAFLVNLCAVLERYDPDLLLTAWGDTWLLPELLRLAGESGLRLPLNREAGREIVQRPERTYFAYGQVIHRGQQLHLFGRWHIDKYNAVMYHDYGLEGIFELARVTSLPIQTVARVSPGTGISSMQIVTALRQGVLVPWHKQQAECPKTALELMQTDQGGLVYQPTVGLHRDVAEVDFVSMYPSIMSHFNISPETIGSERPTAELVPELGMVVDRREPGLIPRTLAPLLEKRIAIKTALIDMPHWDPRRLRYKACAQAHKWLLVTCFGYLGYKNARFGRIEAHEAVTAYGREILLRAKEAAEDLGFSVLHLYVDGMWVKKDGCRKVADFQPLLDAILDRTGLPIALDGIYRWVAFLASRQDGRVPVPNRYFGVFQSGEIKVRGIEMRRRDTPAFVSEMQAEMLRLLGGASDADALAECLPALQLLVRRRLAELRAGCVPLEKLVVRQTLSRTLEEYRSPSPAARGALQLQRVGKSLRPGQYVRLVYTRGEPGVHAWDLPERPDPREVDVRAYRELLLRAAQTVLEPLGLTRRAVETWIGDAALSLPLPLFQEQFATHLPGSEVASGSGFSMECGVAIPYTTWP
jgi:DNA polymerase-2